MMKCLIVDDEEMAIKVLESHIQQIDSLKIVASCLSATQAFSVLQEKEIDLIFLDIQMPRMTGLHFLRTVPNLPPVIITTAHREFALEGFELNVVDYLLKPISLSRFIQSIARVKNYRQNQAQVASHREGGQEDSEDFFYIKSDRQYLKVYLEDIFYIESLRNHVKIVTSEQTYTTLLGISQIEEKLAGERFIRIHRSYIIALNKVRQFSHSQICLGKHELPLGNHYRAQVLKELQKDIL